MVATSQPLATRAGLRALERGGNAADAALAAAAVLCVTEPMSTGIGGDCFAQVWRDGELVGLDSAGPAPASAVPEPVEQTGPRSVTVPGAVAGWAAFSERFGRLGLDACLADAIDAAERGFAVAPVTAARWAALGGPLGTPPRVGEVVRPAGARRDAAANRVGGAVGVLHGRGRRGDLRGVVARARTTSRRSSRAGSSRCASTTRASRSASCRRRRRASARWRRSGCWRARRRGSPGRSGASSSRSRTRSRACGTARTCRS